MTCKVCRIACPIAHVTSAVRINGKWVTWIECFRCFEAGA